MRSNRWIPLLLTVFLAAVPVLADEILHFTNGTTMPVKAHTVVGEMIHIELGANSYLAFPLTQIEKVTRRGEAIDLVRSIGERNRMAASHTVNAAMVDVESSGAGGEAKTMEEKVSDYTRRAREQGLQAAPVRGAGRSTSAENSIRSVQFGAGGGYDARSATVGATPNLSGRRLGLIRANPRKTVGGTVIVNRGTPNSARVELVSKRPTNPASTKSD